MRWSMFSGSKGGNPFGGDTPVPKQQIKEPGLHAAEVAAVGIGVRLTEGYVPPIVAVLPLMAKNEPRLQEAAKKSGLSLERAFEKDVDAAFTILGYETKLLGQGQGRVPRWSSHRPGRLLCDPLGRKGPRETLQHGTR
jgi:hypothetical protein